MNLSENGPKIGICIINFHKKEHTLQCLRSLARQTYRNFEIYLLDNDTTGEFTHNEIHSFSNLNYTISTKNTGFAKGNNILLKKALKDACDYFLFLNNDTVVKKNLLTEYINCFKKNINAGLVSSVITYASSPGTIWFAGGKIHNPWYVTQHIYMNKGLSVLDSKPLYYLVDWISGCAMMVTRSGLAMPFFDEAFFAYLEDVDVSLKIRSQGLTCTIINLPLVNHVVSPSIGRSGSNIFTDKKIILQAKNSAYLIKKFSPRFSNIIVCFNSIFQIGIYIVQKRLSLNKAFLFLSTSISS